MRTCIDCHFLVKTKYENGTRLPEYWDEKERARGSTDVPDVIVECEMNVWSPKVDSSIKYGVEIQKKRRKCKFYMPFKPGMAFHAAKELLHQKVPDRSTKANIFGFIVLFILGVLNLFF